MRLTTNIEYTVPQAIREAVDVLEEEANQLAAWYDRNKESSAHRVNIAIFREIQRLRAIAKSLES